MRFNTLVLWFHDSEGFGFGFGSGGGDDDWIGGGGGGMEGESTGSAANRISSRSSESLFIEREEVSGVKIGVCDVKSGVCVERMGVSCVIEGVSLEGIWLSRSKERISEEGESESR